MTDVTTIEPRTPAAPSPTDTRRRPGAWRLNQTVLLAVILTAQLMIVLDATIVTVALPHIQASLHFTSSGLSWVLNAYILTFGGLLLLGARAGDLIGRRRVFVGGIALFSASSLLGGFAVNGSMLLASRALQGVGGALAAPAALALLTTIFPEGPARLRAIAMFSTVSAAGAALGLVAGGVLTDWASWRWVMFVNVPIGVAVAVLGRLVLSETGRRQGRFDALGALSSTAGMTGLVFGLVQAGTDGWAAPVTIASLAAGVVLLGAFVAIENRAGEPVLPLRLLAHPTRATANAARGLVYAGMYGNFFFLSQYLQNVAHYSPVVAGVAFLPAPISVFLSSQLASKVLLSRLTPKAVMVSGATISLASLLLASRLAVGSPYPQILAQLVLIGIGSGVSLVSLTTAALTEVAPTDAGAASGLVNVSQQLGAALGLAVLVTVFEAVVGPGAAAGTAKAAQLVHGYDVAFLTAAGFAASALTMITVWIRRPAAPALDVETLDELELEIEAGVDMGM